MLLLIPLLFAGLVGFLQGLYTPSMPAMAVALNVDYTQIEHMMGWLLTGAVFSSMILGSLSDRYGRRVVAIGGLVIAIFGGLLCVFAINMSMLYVGQLLQGVCFGSLTLLSRAIALDITHDAHSLNQLYAKVAMVSAVAPVSAPLIGGYVQHYLGWRYNFVALTVIILITLLFTVFRLVETAPLNQTKPVSLFSFHESYQRVLSSRYFVGACVAASLFYVVEVAYLIIAPYIFQRQFGYSADAYGWVGVVAALSLVLGSYLATKRISRYQQTSIIRFGTVLLLLPALLIMWACHSRHISAFGLMGLTSIGFIMIGAMYPSCNSVALGLFRQDAGVSGALYGVVSQLITIAAIKLIASFPHIVELDKFANTVLILTVLAVVFAWWVMPKSSPDIGD